MTIPDKSKVYPRTGDSNTIYLKNAVKNPNIKVGDFTIYNDFVQDPRDFERNNVLYHYPINHDKLIIGKFCSIACGVKFLMNSANHTLRSLSTYPFPLFYEAWGHGMKPEEAWDHRGDIVVGNDVWIGYGAVIFSGITVGDGAVIGAQAVVTKDVEPYSVVCGVPAKRVRKRFCDSDADFLLKLTWWNWPEEKILRYLAEIQQGEIAKLRVLSEKE